MESKELKSFTDMYNELIQKGLLISQINEEKQAALIKQFNKIKENESRYLYMMSILYALLFFTLMPIISFKFNNVSLDGIDALIPLIKEYGSFIHKELSRFYLVMPYFFIMGYLVIIPFLAQKNYINRKSRMLEFVNLDSNFKVDITFIIFSSIIVYFAQLVPLLFFYEYLDEHGLVHMLYHVWVMIPGIVIITICSMAAMLLLILITMPLSSKLIKKNTNEYIICSIVEILYRINKFDSSTYYNDKKYNRIIKLINQTSDSIKNIYKDRKFEDSYTLWAQEQMNVASINFRALIKNIYFSNKNTHKEINDTLINYLNIFLSGNLEELPRNRDIEVALKVKITNRRYRVLKIFKLLSLAFYISLPLIIYIVLIMYLNISIPAILNPILSILYIIWVVVIILTYIDDMNDEAKGIVKDIFRTVINKN